MPHYSTDFTKECQRRVILSQTTEKTLFPLYYLGLMRLSLLHHYKTTSWLLLAKAVFVLIPVMLFISLLNDHVFITKHLSYTYQPGKPAHVIVPKTPAQLLKTADRALRWRISVDNFLFNVTIPRLIESIRVRVRLDPGTQSYVALNAVGVKGADSSTIISATALDALTWKHVSSGGFTLWMRDKHVSEEKISEGTGKNTKTKTITTERTVAQYESIDAFRTNPPDMSTVGLVGVDRMTFAKVDNYKPSSSPMSLGHTLRGSHQLYVYADNETLKLTFDKVDLNRSKGTDGITIRVARVSDLTAGSRTWIKTMKIVDDGVSGQDGPRGKAQPVTVEIPNAVPGVYFVDISTSNDVLLANLKSDQQYLSFNGSVYIADGPAYAEPIFLPVSLKTNGGMVTLAANHDQGKQDVTVNGKKYSIQDVKVDHVVNKLKGETAINIPKGDIIVTSDGLLAFAGFKLLPDGARSVDLTTVSPDLESFDYILAEYVPRTDNKLEVDQTYPLSDLDLAGKNLTFSIYSPGLQASGATLGLKNIRVTFDRGPFPWEKVWKKLGLKK